MIQYIDQVSLSECECVYLDNSRQDELVELIGVYVFQTHWKEPNLRIYDLMSLSKLKTYPTEIWNRK